MKIKYNIKEGGLQITRKPTIEVYYGTLEERNREKGIDNGDGGPLVQIYPREGYIFKRHKLYAGALQLLSRIKATYGERLVGYEQLEREMGIPLNKRNMFRMRLCSLWAQGYLEKWVAGEFGIGAANREAGRAGKWHGVHYRVVEGK